MNVVDIRAYACVGSNNLTRAEQAFAHQQPTLEALFEAAKVAEVSTGLLLDCNRSVPSVLAALVGRNVFVCHRVLSGIVVILCLHVLGARLPLQVAALFDWAATVSNFGGADSRVERVGAVELRCRTVRDVLGDWMLSADLGYAHIRGFAGF